MTAFPWLALTPTDRHVIQTPSHPVNFYPLNVEHQAGKKYVFFLNLCGMTLLELKTPTSS